MYGWEGRHQLHTDGLVSQDPQEALALQTRGLEILTREWEGAGPEHLARRLARKAGQDATHSVVPSIKQAPPAHTGRAILLPAPVITESIADQTVPNCGRRAKITKEKQRLPRGSGLIEVEARNVRRGHCSSGPYSKYVDGAFIS